MKNNFPLLRITILPILLLLASFSVLEAASYDVFLVRGEIIYEGTGEKLTAGTVLASGERIKFVDQEAVAVLMGEGARYTLTGANLGKKFKAGEYFTVKSATKKGKSGLTARPTPEFKKLSDLQEYLGDEPFLILKETEISLPKAKLGIDESAQFYLNCNKRGEAMAATIRLTYRKDILLLSGDAILAAGSINDLSNFTLKLFNGLGKPHQELAKFKPVLLDEITIGDEMTALVEILRQKVGGDAMQGDNLKQAILDYLVEYYGRPDAQNFEEWVQEFI